MAKAIRKRAYNTIDDVTASRRNRPFDIRFLSGITEMGAIRQRIHLSPPRIKMTTAVRKRHIGRQTATMIAFGIPIRL